MSWLGVTVAAVIRRRALLLSILFSLVGEFAAHALIAQPCGNSCFLFQLPPLSSPRSLGPFSDRLWFTESGSNKIGTITTSGVISSFPVTGPPQDIAAGPDGNLWFTQVPDKIVRITLAGALTEFPTSTPSSLPLGITLGPDENLWFSEFLASKIGRITPAGISTEFLIPTPQSEPIGITTGPDGALWFAESGANKIGRIATDGTITEFGIPTANSGPGYIVAGPDSALWFTEHNSNKIGRITVAGVVTEFPISGSPFGITRVGNYLYYTQFPSTIGRITTSGTVTEIPINSNADPRGITVGPDGALWFTEFNANAIGRIDIAGTCTSDATHLCLSGLRFSASAAWQSQTQSGQGQAVALTPDTGFFWFFNASNVEMVVKVLDACSVNGRKWVFAGGLTNVNVVLTVTDTQTGAVRTYVNPQSTAFQPIQDTSAFSTCP